jgi:ABC-type transport system substrate-binding protein
MTLRHALRVTLALAPMAVLAATPLPAQAGPKTPIYCSEGAPEGFNAVFYNSGNTFDATSRTVFDKLVRFELRMGQVPAAREGLRADTILLGWTTFNGNLDNVLPPCSVAMA